MRVKLIQEMSGLRNGEPWPGVGEVMDLPDDEANNMLLNGGAIAPDQKHAIVDAHRAARLAAEAKTKVDYQAGLEAAKVAAKAAAVKAAADEKAWAMAEAAARNALRGGPVTTTTSGLAPGEEWDATAAAQAHADSLGVDLGPVKGTGVGGTVTKGDVQAAADKKGA